MSHARAAGDLGFTLCFRAGDCSDRDRLGVTSHGRRNSGEYMILPVPHCQRQAQSAAVGAPCLSCKKTKVCIRRTQTCPGEPLRLNLNSRRVSTVTGTVPVTGDPASCPAWNLGDLPGSANARRLLAWQAASGTRTPGLSQSH